MVNYRSNKKQAVKALNIAFVVDIFPSISETFILNQITYLIDQGHNVSIYSRVKGANDIIHNQISDYKLLEKTLYFPPKVKSFTKRFGAIFKSLIREKDVRFFFSIFKCLNLFKLGKPSLTLYVAYNYAALRRIEHNCIIHAHFGTSGIFVSYLKKAGLLKNSSIITSFHGYDLAPNKVEENRMIYQNLFLNSKVITVNTFYSLELLKLIKNDVADVEVLPVGLDTDKFKKGIEEDKKDFITITFCGRLILLKGAHVAVRIVAELRKNVRTKFELKIIGQGPEYFNLKQLIIDLELQDFVFLIGALSQEEVQETLSTTDIFLFPGISDPETGRCETQGLVIQEAQSMEIPVVISDVGGMKYGVLNGKTGYVVNDGDIDGYVEVLTQLISRPDKRKVMGVAAREHAIRGYDYKLLGERLEKMYFKML